MTGVLQQQLGSFEEQIHNQEKRLSVLNSGTESFFCNSIKYPGNGKSWSLYIGKSSDG